MQKKENFLSLKNAFNQKIELKQYLDLSLEMFCVCDLDGRIIYTNQSFNSVTGYDLDDKLLLKFVHADDLVKMTSVLSNYRKDKVPVQLFYSRFLTKKGNVKWFSWNIVYDETNKVSFFSARETTKIYENREQLNLFNVAFDNAKEAIIIAENVGTLENPNSAIVYANQTFLDYSGHSFDDIIGKNPLMMGGTDENEDTMENIKQAMENWESIDVEVRNETKNGKNIWVSLSISPIENEEGILTHWITIQRDITERIAKEEKLRMFEAAVAHSKDSVIITQAEPSNYPDRPNIVYVNDAFCERTGFTREDVIGKTPRILQGALTSEKAKGKMKKAFLKWEPVQIDILNYKKNKESFWVELSIFPIANEHGFFTQWVSIQRDITERIKLRERLEHKVKVRTRALEESNSKLEDFASVASQDLKEGTRSLEESNRKLKAFAHVVSHDLKAPLRMIVSYLEILKRKFTKKIGEEAATVYKDEFEYLKFAQIGAKEANDLIEGVLKYSQIQSAEADWEIIDLNEKLKTVLVLLRKDITVSEAKVTYGDLPTIKAHKVQMKQLFQNLIANAIKFRGKNPCEIRVEATKYREGYVFEIRDNGIGMLEADQNVIFDLFGRAKTTRKYQGQGIGLSLCKEIIEQHNGEIWVESTIGEGSSFYFSLNI
jgi:PAS domain S-box-containing protein